MLSDKRMEEIENIALDALIISEYPEDEDFIDVVSVAKKLGFAIGNAILKNSDDGFILIKEGVKELLGLKSDRVIGFNTERSVEWKRFIIAHELGHYMLDYRENNQTGMYANRSHEVGHDESENEIDFFAACLLMPRERFIRKYEKIKSMSLKKSDIDIMMANYFGVTIKMASRRSKELKLN